MTGQTFTLQLLTFSVCSYCYVFTIPWPLSLRMYSYNTTHKYFSYLISSIPHRVCLLFIIIITFYFHEVLMKSLTRGWISGHRCMTVSLCGGAILASINHIMATSYIFTLSTIVTHFNTCKWRYCLSPLCYGWNTYVVCLKFWAC